MPRRKILGILGTSFCGSSLLNMMLDSHPQIFGAGEVHKFFVPEKAAFCSICLTNCKLWDAPSVRENITPASLYEVIGNITGAEVILDSSKTPSHFETMRSVAPQHDYHYVMLVKHPLRLTASFLGNQYIPKNIGLDGYAKDGLSSVDEGVLTTAIRVYLEKVSRSYKAAESVSGDRGWRVSYESVVTDAEHALASLLTGLGLPWDDSIIHYSDCEHHPIGGNAAAHYHVRKQINPGGQKKREKKMIPEKLAYYKDRDRELKVDDKYQSTLRDGLEEKVRVMPAYKALCAQLGYSEDL